jgi:hypothetical protein
VKPAAGAHGFRVWVVSVLALAIPRQTVTGRLFQSPGRSIPARACPGQWALPRARSQLAQPRAGSGGLKVRFVEIAAQYRVRKSGITVFTPLTKTNDEEGIKEVVGQKPVFPDFLTFFLPPHSSTNWPRSSGRHSSSPVRLARSVGFALTKLPFEQIKWP